MGLWRRRTAGQGKTGVLVTPLLILLRALVRDIIECFVWVDDHEVGGAYASVGKV